MENAAHTEIKGRGQHTSHTLAVMRVDRRILFTWAASVRTYRFAETEFNRQNIGAQH